MRTPAPLAAAAAMLTAMAPALAKTQQQRALGTQPWTGSPLPTDPATPAAGLGSTSNRGRMGRQKASGYKRRALVEADVPRWNRVIGDGFTRGSARDGRPRWPSLSEC
jgi:hypothetical protein